MNPAETAYHPRQYWGERVTGNGSLANVGQVALGHYNNFTYPRRLAGLTRALRGLVPPQVRVFDGGFGEGLYLDYWRERGALTVAGLDFSERATRAALRRHPGFDLRTGDLSRSEDFASLGRYDVVTAIDVLYHVVDDTAWTMAIGNLLSLVQQDGLFVFSDKFPAAGTFQPMPHVRRRSLDTWRAQLTANGFEIVRRTPVFVLMDDPITNGSNRWLGQLARFQWRAGTKLIRMAARHAGVQRTVASAIALAQLAPERLLVRWLSSAPNLELVVCRRPARRVD